MSECVVRMKKPDDCLKCGVRHICNPYVDYWQQDTRKKPKPGQKGCLIICQLPEGHGRLIDADALKQSNIRKPRLVTSFDYGAMATVFMDVINDAPTIVPAEPPKEDA